MKRFRFRLERLRRVRRILDRQARQALAEAIAERVRIETTLEELRETRRHRVLGMTSLQSEGPLDPRDILLQEADLAALARRADRIALELSTAMMREEERASALADARRDLEVVEKLRDRALTEHVAKSRREEAASLDEHTARGHIVARAMEDER